MKNPYSIGKQIYLRAPEREDLEGNWYEWLSDPEITQYLGDRSWPNNKEKQKEFFESFVPNLVTIETRCIFFY